jgi:hypothetical protein
MCAVAGVVTAIAGPSLLATPADAANSCPNESIRSEQGVAALALPACRAYEQVSPLGAQPYFTAVSPGKTGASENLESVEVVRLGTTAGQQIASADGDRFAYFSSAATSGSLSDGPYYLGTRGVDGWSVQNVMPPQSRETPIACLPFIAAWSSDLSLSILADGWNPNPAQTCGVDEPELVPAEPRSAQNLFLRDNEASTYRLLNTTPSEITPRNATFLAASSDLSHVAFREEAQLTPEAPPLKPENNGNEVTTSDFYIAANGVVRLLTILPSGGAVQGELVEATHVQGINLLRHSPVGLNAVSSDGERVFWQTSTVTANATEPTALYLRLNAGEPSTATGECAASEPTAACTVRLDSVQGGTGEGRPEPRFRFASADGSRAFFTDEQNLTQGSTAAPGKPDLYEYDLQRPEGKRLVDLTADEAEPADVLGVSGIAADGSSIYFVAEGALTPPTSENAHHEHAVSGQPNLYRRQGGVDTYIATLAPGPIGDQCDWGEGPHFTCRTSRVSPDGNFIAFNSIRELTGYDSTPVEPTACIASSFGESGSGAPQACQEVFLYDAGTEGLSCASCSPSGEPPQGPSSIPTVAGLFTFDNTVGYGFSRNLSDGGRIFFDTPSSLLPTDTDGVSDVYEFADGQIHLISSGTSPVPSYFYEASESGNDVFFLTVQPLVRADTDGEMSIYDARVDGGFPEPPEPPVCETECRSAASQASATGSPATPSFAGPEEGPKHPQTPPCKKGFVKKHGKCVKTQSKKHHSKKHHSKKHKRANTNRRAGK